MPMKHFLLIELMLVLGLAAEPIYKETFDTRPRYFEVVKRATSKIQADTDLEVGHLKSGSRRLTLPSGAADGGSLSRYQNVKPGHAYTFVVYAKATGFSDETSIRLSAQTRDGKFQQLPPPTPVIVGRTSQAIGSFRDWRRITLTVVFPASDPKWAPVKKLIFLYGVHSDGAQAGTVWFDEVEIYEMPEEEFE